MTERREAGRGAAAARLQHFVFEVTQQCNHGCPHCYNAWKNRTPYPMGQLPTDETLAMLDAMLEQTRAQLVSLSGGEPLLRDDLPQIVRHLSQRRVAVNLICNGSLLDEPAIDRILAAGPISIFELPLLSVDHAVHDRMSGRAGAFDKVTLAMANLKAARQRVVGVFVATRLNLHQWAETIELAVALGLDGLMFNRFNPGGRGGENIDVLQATPAELQQAMDTAERLGARYDMPISCSIAMPPCLFDTKRYKRLTFGYCAAGTDRAYYTLDPLGNVRPCNHSMIILGNIRQTAFAAMAASEAMQQFKEARPAFCRGCAVEEECLGGCKAAAEVCCGSAEAMDPFLSAYSGQARKVK